MPLLCGLLAMTLHAGTVAAAPAHTLALGAYIVNAPGDPSQIDAFTGMVGVAPGIVMWYQDWVTTGNSAFDPIKMDAAASRGAMPMITWEPWDASAGPNQPAYSLSAIVAGAHDAFIHQWARDAAAWGKPLYLKFAHEMNGNWYPWAANVNGNTAAQYIAMWAHVHTIFRQEGAINARWVWSPNVAYPGSTPFAQVYPGDKMVDWVGLDGYNFGTSQSWSQWTSFADVFGPSYDSVARIASKPMLIGETASAEVGGDKAAWITQGLLRDLPARFPRLRAVIWFDEDKETDWRVNSSSATLAAFRTVAASPTYRGYLP
jgi:beta-mannanase